jgi:hypothetical protein
VLTVLVGISDSVEACNIVTNWLMFKTRKNADPNSDFNFHEFNKLLSRKMVNSSSLTIEELIEANIENLFLRHHDKGLRTPIAHYLCHIEEKKRLTELLDRTSLVRHKWLTMQTKMEGKHTGGFSLRLATEGLSMTISSRGPGILPLNPAILRGDTKNMKALSDLIKRASSLLSEGENRIDVYESLKTSLAHEMTREGLIKPASLKSRRRREDYLILHDVGGGKFQTSNYGWHGDFSFYLANEIKGEQFGFNPQMVFNYNQNTNTSRYHLTHKTFIRDGIPSQNDKVSTLPKESRYLTLKISDSEVGLTLFETLVNFGIYRVNFSIRSMNQTEKDDVLSSSDGNGYINKGMNDFIDRWNWGRHPHHGNMRLKTLNNESTLISESLDPVGEDSEPIDYGEIDLEHLMNDYDVELEPDSLESMAKVFSETNDETLEGLELDFMEDVDYDLGTKWVPRVRNTVAFSEIERIQSLPQRILFSDYHGSVSLISEDQIKGFHNYWCNMMVDKVFTPFRELHPLMYHSELLNFIYTSCFRIKVDPLKYLNMDSGRLLTKREIKNQNYNNDPRGWNRYNSSVIHVSTTYFPVSDKLDVLTSYYPSKYDGDDDKPLETMTPMITQVEETDEENKDRDPIIISDKTKFIQEESKRWMKELLDVSDPMSDIFRSSWIDLVRQKTNEHNISPRTRILLERHWKSEVHRAFFLRFPMRIHELVMVRNKEELMKIMRTIPEMDNASEEYIMSGVGGIFLNIGESQMR